MLVQCDRTVDRPSRSVLQRWPLLDRASGRTRTLARRHKTLMSRVALQSMGYGLRRGQILPRAQGAIFSTRTWRPWVKRRA